MMFKVSYNSQLKSDKDLILIIMDESLELRDDIAMLDKKYDGIVSDAIKDVETREKNKPAIKNEIIINNIVLSIFFHQL